MKINFNISGSVDISADEIIKIIQESERLEEKRFNPVGSPAPTPKDAKPVQEVKEELFIGKIVKMNYLLSEEDIKELGYGDFKGGEVTEETPIRIKIKEDAMTHYWHHKHLFEVKKEETK